MHVGLSQLTLPQTLGPTSIAKKLERDAGYKIRPCRVLKTYQGKKKKSCHISNRHTVTYLGP